MRSLCCISCPDVIFILNSCCVDEVAAQHVNADGIIHFGHACLTPTNGSLPKLYVFEKLPVDCDHFVSCFTRVLTCKTAKILLLYDVCYQHAIGE
jgi:diphthamide biosynthesis protein 2